MSSGTGGAVDQAAYWERAYDSDAYVFGTEPSEFLRDAVGYLTGPRVLCLGEGEGRHAVFLAARGFVVTSIELTAAGVAKTRRLAAARGVAVDARIGDLATTVLGVGRWDGVVSMFVHVAASLRSAVHGRVVTALAPGGAVLLEAFTPAQIGRGTGGPQDADLMPTLAQLRVELDGLELLHAVELERPVHAGAGHAGPASLVQVVARRR